MFLQSTYVNVIYTVQRQKCKHLCSQVFGSAFNVCSMENREGLVYNLIWAWHNWEQKGKFHVFSSKCMFSAWYVCQSPPTSYIHVVCMLCGIFALFTVLSPSAQVHVQSNPWPPIFHTASKERLGGPRHITFRMWIYVTTQMNYPVVRMPSWRVPYQQPSLVLILSASIVNQNWYAWRFSIS